MSPLHGKIARLRQQLDAVEALCRRPGTIQEGHAAALARLRVLAEITRLEAELRGASVPSPQRRVATVPEGPPLPPDDGVDAAFGLPPGPLETCFGWDPPPGAPSAWAVPALVSGVLRLSPSGRFQERQFRCLHPSREGERAWAAARDGSVRCFDLRAGELVWEGRATLGPDEGVVGIALDDDEFTVTLLTDGFVLHRCDAITGAWLEPRAVEVPPADRRPPGSTVALYYGGLAIPAFSDSGRWLVTAWGDGHVRITELRTLETWELPGVQSAGAVAFAPGRDVVAVATQGSIRILDPAAGTTLAAHDAQVDPFPSMKWHPAGRELVWYDREARALRVLDVETGAERRPIAMRAPTRFAWSPGGGLLATCHYEEGLSLWHPELAVPVATLSGPHAHLFGLAWHAPARQLLVSGIEDVVLALDVRGPLAAFDGLDADEEPPRATSEAVTRASGSLAPIQRIPSCGWLPMEGWTIELRFNHDRTALAALVEVDGTDRRLHVWDLRTLEGRVLDAARVSTFAWHPDGERLALGSSPVLFVDRHGKRLGELPLTIGIHIGHAYGICWSPDGTSLAVAHENGKIAVWNPAAREKAWEAQSYFAIEGPLGGSPYDFGWHPTGGLYGVGKGGDFYAWRTAPGPTEPDVHIRARGRGAFDETGTLVLSGNGIYRAETGERVGGTPRVLSGRWPAWIRGAPVLRSGDDPIQLSRGDRDEDLACFYPPEGRTSAAAWSADGALLATAHRQGVRLWRLDEHLDEWFGPRATTDARALPPPEPSPRPAAPPASHAGWIPVDYATFMDALLAADAEATRVRVTDPAAWARFAAEERYPGGLPADLGLLGQPKMTGIRAGLYRGVYAYLVEEHDPELQRVYRWYEGRPVQRPLHRYSRGEMFDVAISYASEDRERFALPLARALEGGGLRPYLIDVAEDPDDALWRLRFREGAFRSRILVPVISPSYLLRSGTIDEMFELAGLNRRHRSTELFSPFLPWYTPDIDAEALAARWAGHRASSDGAAERFDWVLKHAFAFGARAPLGELIRFLASLCRAGAAVERGRPMPDADFLHVLAPLVRGCRVERRPGLRHARLVLAHPWWGARTLEFALTVDAAADGGEVARRTLRMRFVGLCGDDVDLAAEYGDPGAYARVLRWFGA